MIQLILWLQGKKTIISAVVYGVDAVGSHLGWWDADSVRAIVEQVLTIVFLRNGVTTAAPAIAPPKV